MRSYRVWCINGDFDSQYDNPHDALDRMSYLMFNHCECYGHVVEAPCYFYDVCEDGYIVNGP